MSRSVKATQRGKAQISLAFRIFRAQPNSTPVEGHAPGVPKLSSRQKDTHSESSILDAVVPDARITLEMRWGEKIQPQSLVDGWQGIYTLA